MKKRGERSRAARIGDHEPTKSPPQPAIHQGVFTGRGLLRKLSTLRADGQLFFQGGGCADATGACAYSRALGFWVMPQKPSGMGTATHWKAFPDSANQVWNGFRKSEANGFRGARPVQRLLLRPEPSKNSTLRPSCGTSRQKVRSRVGICVVADDKISGTAQRNTGHKQLSHPV